MSAKGLACLRSARVRVISSWGYLRTTTEPVDRVTLPRCARCDRINPDHCGCWQDHCSSSRSFRSIVDLSCLVYALPLQYTETVHEDQGTERHLMAKRPRPPGQLQDEVSSLRPEKMLKIPTDMPERLRDIVTKKQSLLEQIWVDQRTMIQYERSYLTACSYGNVLKGYTPVQAEIPFEGVSQCKFSLSCTRMRWYVAKCAELNNRVKEDLKAFKEQFSQQQPNAPPKRQQLMGGCLQEDPHSSTAFNSGMQAAMPHAPPLSAGAAAPPKRLSSLGGYDRGGGGTERHF